MNQEQKKNNLPRTFFLTFIFLTFPFTVYGNSKSEGLSRSAATLSAMLEAAEAGDWEKYVDEFYGEQHKFRSSSDRDKLVLRFREKWGSKVIAGLKEATQVEPYLSGDGSKAIFPWQIPLQGFLKENHDRLFHDQEKWPGIFSERLNFFDRNIFQGAK